MLATPLRTWDVWYSTGAHLELDAPDSMGAIACARSIWPEGDHHGRIARAVEHKPAPEARPRIRPGTPVIRGGR
jgi:hypothetical protein